MKEVMVEYAGAVVSMIGGIGFVLLFGHVFMGADGFFAQLIQLYVEGGI